MNILAINNLFLPKLNNNSGDKRILVAPYYGLTLASPLKEDVVSFKGTPKLLTNAGKKGGVTKATAIKINKIAEEIQPEIEAFIKGIFVDYISTKENPDRIIEIVKGRAKKPDSIVEKTKTLNVSDMNTAFHVLTDLNATKIVLADASRKNIHKVLDVLYDAIRRNLVILEEVEVKRPKASEKLKGKDAEKYDYADPAYLTKFVRKVEENTNRKVNYPEPDLTPANYTAIHFLLRLPGQKRNFELQLMGHNVAVFKDMDDIIYKILNNKNVDKKYSPIVKQLKTIALSDDDKTMLKYIKLKDKLEKLKFTDIEMNVLRIRLASEKPLTGPKDSREYMSKVNALIRAKDFEEEDLNMLIDGTQYLVESLSENELKELKNRAEMNARFKLYRSEAFLFQREKKPNPYNLNAKEYFLPLTEALPAEFDLNELWELYKKCSNEDIN